jgi:hypothetical protein
MTDAHVFNGCGEAHASRSDPCPEPSVFVTANVAADAVLTLAPSINVAITPASAATSSSRRSDPSLTFGSHARVGGHASRRTPAKPSYSQRQTTFPADEPAWPQRRR